MTRARGFGPTLGTLALWIARSRGGGRLAQLVCAHAPGLLPATRVIDAGRALVIRHPRPEFPGHLVIVPKARVRSLCELVARGRADVFLDVLAAARLAAPLAGDDGDRGDDDLVLSINLGGRQEVDQLHAHLIPARRAGILLDGTVSRAPLPLGDRSRLLAALAAVAEAAGGCDQRVEGSLVLLGFTGATPELRASRADAPETRRTPDGAGAA